MAKIPGLATVVQKGRELQHRRAHKKAHKQALEQHNQHIETLHPGNPKKAAEAFLRVMHPTSPRHPNQATSLELTHGVLSSGKKGSVLEHMLNRKLEKGKRENTFAEFSEALFGTVRDPNLKEQLTGELAERLQKVDRDARQVRIGTLVSRVITSSLTFAINPILGGTIAAASLILPTSKRLERRAVRAEVRKLVKQKYEKVAQQHLDNFEKLITGITAPLTNPPTERSGERHKQAFSFASAFVEDLKKRHLIPENATPQDAAKFIKKALDWQKEFNSLDPTTRKRSRLKLGRKLSKKAMQEVAHSRAIIAALEDHLINLEPNKVPENLRRRLEAYQKGRQRLLELGQVIHNLPQALGKAPKLSKIREELQGRKVHHNPFIRSLQYIVKLIKLTPGAIAGTLEAGAAAAFGYALGSVTMAITGGTLGVPIIITAATFFAATEARRLYKIHKTPEKMPYGSHTNAHERSRARIQQLNAKAAKENPGIGKRAGKAAVRLAKNAAKGAGKAVIMAKQAVASRLRQERQPTGEQAKQALLQELKRKEGRPDDEKLPSLTERAIAAKISLIEIIKAGAPEDKQTDTQKAIKEEFNNAVELITDPQKHEALAEELNLPPEQAEKLFKQFDNMSDEDREKLKKAFAIYVLRRIQDPKTIREAFKPRESIPQGIRRNIVSSAQNPPTTWYEKARLLAHMTIVLETLDKKRLAQESAPSPRPSSTTHIDYVIQGMLRHPPTKHAQDLQSIINHKFETQEMDAPLNMWELLNNLREKTATTLKVFTSKDYEKARALAFDKLRELADAEGISQAQINRHLEDIKQELKHINSTPLNSKERRELDLAYAFAEIYEYRSISPTAATPAKLALKLLSTPQLSSVEKAMLMYRLTELIQYAYILPDRVQAINLNKHPPKQ